MTPGKTLKVTVSGDTDLVMTREFNASRDLVYRAITEPALLKRWMLGPPGWTMETCEIDLRVGGKYRFGWENTEGGALGMHGVYRQIVAPERIVCTEEFVPAMSPSQTILTMQLTELNGVTRLQNTLRYSSKEVRDAVLGSGMEQGAGASYDRLEDVLQTL